MKAKPGYERDARKFLEEALRRISAEEPGTTSFHALELGDGAFAIFSTFADEAAVGAHVQGPVGAWVQEKNPELFDAPYAVTQSHIIALKPNAQAAAA
jgi:quinol monooxygenase YgiN